MIKINLLPQKRAKGKRAAVASSSGGDSASKALLFGLGGLVGAAAIVFLVFDLPARSERSDYAAKNRQLAGEIANKKKSLEGYDLLKQEEANAVAKIQGINRLVNAKVVPANILHELGLILSQRNPDKTNTCAFTGCPTMTELMSKQVDSDPNKKIQVDWDPQHVWLSGFSDTDGTFILEGGAQSKEDVTQLSKRLAASVYFADVTPQSGDRVNDKDSGLNYYKFTITGKVAY